MERAKSLGRPLMGRATRRGLAAQFRLLTASMRLLPEFIIIGAQKGGTSSLYNYLIQHPWIASSARKEVHFFDSNFDRGCRWYQAQFPFAWHRSYARLRRQQLITGEASPYYIFHPFAARRIFEMLPRVKLVAVLRNPVDRAYSHYHHNVRRRRETLSFEEAIRAETERLAGERAKMLKDSHFLSYNYSKYSYLARGVYIDQLQEWFRLFPTEQMLILKSEDLFADPATAYSQVLDFLNLPDWRPPRYDVYYAGNYRDKMPAELRRHLAEYFRPFNRRLYQFLGRDFGWDE